MGLAVSVVMVPLAGLFLALVLRWSGDPALTDQEIAGFLLSPVGAGAAMVAAVLLLVWRLSGWALALHLRLIDRVPAGA